MTYESHQKPIPIESLVGQLAWWLRPGAETRKNCTAGKPRLCAACSSDQLLTGAGANKPLVGVPPLRIALGGAPQQKCFLSTGARALRRVRAAGAYLRREGPALRQAHGPYLPFAQVLQRSQLAGTLQQERQDIVPCESAGLYLVELAACSMHARPASHGFVPDGNLPLTTKTRFTQHRVFGRYRAWTMPARQRSCTC